MFESKEQLSHLTRVFIQAKQAFTNGDFDTLGKLLEEGSGRNGHYRLNVPFESQFLALCKRTNTTATVIVLPPSKEGPPKMSIAGNNDAFTANIAATLKAGAAVVAEQLAAEQRAEQQAITDAVAGPTG